jgi:ankyrin repeat protein
VLEDNCHIDIIIPLHLFKLFCDRNGQSCPTCFPFHVVTMRLLHTRTLKLEEFGSNQIPRYAILSHTWGAEEVTLHNIKTDDGRELLGYEKIKNACSVATADDFDYIWIDTCCIDKTSSAELSEALNSMYRWYEEAEECYAYFADVPRGIIDHQTGVADDKFRASRWFTRGWTLQELIAPSTVVFLNSDWRKIGSKSSLQQLISEITGIPGGFLLGDDLEHASVAQRMSWASKRETTRIEDLAYSLMGIFGIYMPMLYGEGERAFIRLQEEIMKVSNDHSLFAWKSIENHGGILATSPSAFADSGNIIQKTAPNVVSSPLTVSSRGIRLSLPFKTGQQGFGLAILDCAEGGKESVRLALHLREISLTKEDFTREQSSTLEPLDLKDIDLSQYPRRDLYVRKWRSTRNRKWGDVEKYAIKLEGVDWQVVASHIIHLHSNWELHDGLMATTVAPTSDGVLGRVLVMCKDGNSFQILLKKYGRSLSVDIQTSLKADSELDQAPVIPEQQHEKDRVVRILDAGQHVQVAIKKRILMLHKTKYVTGVVEINYLSPPRPVWLQHIAVLEGDIEEMTLLTYAARRGYQMIVKLLLDTKKIDINSKDKDGLTPLLWAAENGHDVIVKLLLMKGAEKETKDREGRTPLSLAAEKGHAVVVKLLLEKGHEGVVKLLLEKGADKETQDKEGRTPLSWAAEKGHEAVVKLLLEKGSEKETKDGEGRTPLSWAAEKGHQAVVRLLLEKGAEKDTKDREGRTPPLWAPRYRNRLLFDRGAENKIKDKEGPAVDVDSNWKDKLGRTPLSYASQSGNEAVVKLLLDTGKVDIDSEDGDYRTPLSWAAQSGHEAIVKLLLDTSKVDIDSKDDRTPLSYAAQSGNEAVVKLLLDTGKVDIDYKDLYDRTPLSWAAENGHEAVVKLLLHTSKVDINSKDAYDRTPLSWAAENGHGAVVKLLLHTGKVDINSKDKYNWTPLSWAVTNGHEDVVKLLLNTCKINIHSRYKHYWTPLLYAAENGHEAVVKLLLDASEVDIDSKDTYDHTPLFWGVINRYEAVAKLLLDTGKVDIDSKDKYDRTPLLWAAKYRHEAVVKLLLNTTKVDIDSKDKDYGRTPLLWAAQNGHEAIVKLLLDTSKVNIDSKDKDDRTPLLWAAKNRHEAIVKLLLDTGKVDIDSKDKYDRTPLLWAVENGHETIIKLLTPVG